MRRRMHLVVCSVACLAIAGPAAMAEGAFDGDYVGKRVLTKGPAERCPGTEDVSVTILEPVLIFTNSALHDYPISFHPHPDGTFRITHVDFEGGYVDIQGRVTGGVLTADVNNPPCVHHWQLKK
jgi:hypothetical protein